MSLNIYLQNNNFAAIEKATQNSIYFISNGIRCVEVSDVASNCNVVVVGNLVLIDSEKSKLIQYNATQYYLANENDVIYIEGEPLW